MASAHDMLRHFTTSVFKVAFGIMWSVLVTALRQGLAMEKICKSALVSFGEENPARVVAAEIVWGAI